MDRVKIAKEMLRVARELQGSVKYLEVSFKFGDSEDAMNFAEMYELRSQGRKVFGNLHISDLGVALDDLDNVYGVRPVVLTGSY